MISRLFACCLALVWSTSLIAAPMQFNYAWNATNISDSNGNPPPNGLISTSGTFSVVFDPLGNLTLEDVPIVEASPFTDNEGVTLTQGDIFSTIKVQTAGINRTYRIAIGGIVSPLDKADQSVGDTNDFRLEFLVFGGTGANVGQWTGSDLPQSYSVSNGAFGSQVGVLNPSLVSIGPLSGPAAIPLPAGAVLLLSALGLGLGLRAVRR